VETELKAQRDLMQQGFAQMEKRFEQIDKRFEDLRADMNDRFTQVDKRFDDMHRHTSRWMTALMIVVALTSLAATVTNMMG
jgi:tetrahydromethanopterin S-methyltransferase subunit G